MPFLGKLSELRIVFERAAPLCRRQIFIAAEPVSCVARLILRRTSLSLGRALVRLRTGLLRMRLRRPLWLRMPGLGERRRQHKKGCQTARNSFPA